MLHKINLPDCRIHFKWIENFQRELLTVLCRPDFMPGQVTVQNLCQELSDMDAKIEWLRSFFNRGQRAKDKQRSVLKCMQIIASLPPEEKKELLDSFEHDLNFKAAFDIQNRQPHRLRGLAFLKDKNAQQAVKDLFESFYTPTFYDDHGYLIPLGNGNHFQLSKQVFLEGFEKANTVKVCPMCDGEVDTPEVDHFYPKAQYPFLSCHPLNLTPVCKSCNSPKNKDDKPPLNDDPLDPDPTVDWFHPYLRTADGEFTLTIEGTPQGSILKLHSEDAQTQNRLKNLDDLVNLTNRWKKIWASRITTATGTMRRLRRDSPGMSKDDLCKKFKDEAADWGDGRGIIGFTLVHQFFYEAAAKQAPEVFDELWTQYYDADPVTAI